MNAIEIVGLACVDPTFRKQLFGNVEVIIAANRADLTWAEEEGLRRIIQPNRPRKPRPAALVSPGAPSASAASAAEDPNTLEQDMEKVGRDIDMMCPTVPCPWPDAFTQNKPTK